MSDMSFSGLKLQPALLESLSSLGYDTMTPVQAQSLPSILAGQDVIGQGKTGSGKTAAFGLGLLNRLNPERFQVQALVLCPTRELADQVAREIRRLARAMGNVKVLALCGGTPIGPQIGSLEHGAHIIVGTPGRIEDHLRKRTLDLSQLQTLVLDEADRMFDMGFESAVEAVFASVPQARQTLLFSATFPAEAERVAQRFMHKPLRVQVEERHDDSSIHQHFILVQDDKQRMSALRALLLKLRPESAVVFCNTKNETRDLEEALCREGFDALALHGDLVQKERDQALVRFANKSVAVLVATDVAARGLDIESLDAVFNYHLARDAEVHTHRIGRTGRAGEKGHAYTFYTDRETHKVARLEAELELSIKPEPVPEPVDERAYKAPMVTLQIDGGKKQKVRPGDVLGALTGEAGIAGNQVGKIDIFDNWAYVAVTREARKTALTKLRDGKLKGRSFRARAI